MTTSLTNTLLNKLIILFAFRKHQHLLYDFFVEGDDNIIGINDLAAVQLLTDAYSSLGISPTIEYCGSFDGSTFCKMIFKYYQGDYIAYKLLGPSLHKIGWKVVAPTKARLDVRNRLTSFYATYEGSKCVEKLCQAYAKAAKVDFVKAHSKDVTMDEAARYEFHWRGYKSG